MGNTTYGRLTVDSVSEIDLEQLTQENLRVHHGTGQSVLISGSGRDKKFRYRVGKQTNLGDIENSVWKELVRMLIEKNGDQELVRNYREWNKGNKARVRNEAELEEETFEYYTAQLCLSRSWCDYVCFNRRYYPERLDNDPTLIRIRVACCDKECRVPEEQFHHNYEAPDSVPCPFCGRGSSFTIIE